MSACQMRFGATGIAARFTRAFARRMMRGASCVKALQSTIVPRRQLVRR